MEIKHISIRGHRFLSPLKELAKPPESLYLKGQLPKHRQLVVAIIGTRRPSPYGKKVTFNLAYTLARHGVVIVSGLAYGIDAIAHQAALRAGGTTIAVIPSSLDAIYPAAHQKLAKQIVEKGGAVMSEHRTNPHPQKFHFLTRNRLVSGLADAVIVVEARERSGTFSTVNHALDQNKEVFAVPGNITSATSQGPNRLIRQGAHPVTNVQDIFDVIAPHLTEKSTKIQRKDKNEQRILELLQTGEFTSDELQKSLIIPSATLSVHLSVLEIEGLISKRQGKYVSRASFDIF